MLRRAPLLCFSLFVLANALAADTPSRFFSPKVRSGATPIAFTDDPLIPGSSVIRALHLTEVRSAIDTLRATAGLAAAAITDPSPSGVPVKAIHILELRSALDEARKALALTPVTYANSVTTGSIIHAVDLQELRDGTRVAGVACPLIVVTNPSATMFTVNTFFNDAFTQSGATPAVTFSIASGVLPSGVTLSADGTLSGTSTQSGSFPIAVRAAGSDGCAGTGATYNLSILPQPSIATFGAAPSTVTAGDSSQLTAIFDNGNALITNSQTNETIVPTSGAPSSVTPGATTDYMLAVTNAAGAVATRTTTVTVVAPPQISSFSASASTISVGHNATLTATFSGGTATITNNVDPSTLVVTSGTPNQVVLSAATTYVFTLSVTNAAGTTVAQTTSVTVVPLPSGSLAVTPASVPVGSSVAVTPTFSGGAATLTDNRGGSPVSPVSGVGLVRYPSADTTYTLTITNAANDSVSYQASVTVISFCASGLPAQAFSPLMHGCAGTVPFTSRSTLCGAGYHVCTANDWVLNQNGIAPSHNYWTDDALRFGSSGSTGNCLVSGGTTGTTACSVGAAMHVCTPGGSDPEGNTCAWVGCGFNTLTPNMRFGGCSSTAGTLCCASKQFFVDATNGSDVNSGSSAAPFKTITKALTVAGASDTVFVRPGTYDASNGEVFPLNIPANVALIGDEAKRGSGVQPTVIAGCSASAAVTLGANAAIAGFTVNCAAVGVRNTSAQGLIRNNTISSNTTAGVYDVGSAVVTFNTFSANYVGIWYSTATPGGKAENNDINNNTYGVYYATDGGDLGGGSASSSGGNVISCNTNADLYSAFVGTIYAANNRWDHSSPTTSTTPTGGIDLASSPSTVFVTIGSTVAVSPCP